MSYEIKSERVKGNEPKIFREGGRNHYYVRIFVKPDQPEELDEIDSVQYELHPTFRQRNQVATLQTNGFEIRIWTYGFFNAKAKIIKKVGAPESKEVFVHWETSTPAT